MFHFFCVVQLWATRFNLLHCCFSSYGSHPVLPCVVCLFSSTLGTRTIVKAEFWDEIEIEIEIDLLQDGHHPVSRKRAMDTGTQKHGSA